MTAIPTTITNACRTCRYYTNDDTCCLDEILPRPLNQIRLDDMGDDEHIENHVSPSCVVGGDV